MQGDDRVPDSPCCLLAAWHTRGVAKVISDGVQMLAASVALCVVAHVALRWLWS